MSYEFLQQYWWLVVSLLGALLVFLLFVQGANSMVHSIGHTEEGQRKVLASTGLKWEITFTTLVTFGGAFFASFPLFYSTSFGGAYWLWMIILFSFVLQAVSYEFQLKRGNLLGTRTYRYFLILNGIFGPLLLGGAVATFFNGSNFIVDKASLTSVGSPVISRWANASAGLDALLDPWNLMLGLAVMFLARILGTLYIINNVGDEAIRTRSRRQLLVNTVPFLAFFLAFFIRTLLKDGYAVNAETGMIFMEPMKYLHNYLTLWPTAVLTLVGVLLLLYGIVRSLLHSAYTKGIWPAGTGVVLLRQHGPGHGSSFQRGGLSQNGQPGGGPRNFVGKGTAERRTLSILLYQSGGRCASPTRPKLPGGGGWVKTRRICGTIGQIVKP